MTFGNEIQRTNEKKSEEVVKLRSQPKNHQPTASEKPIELTDVKGRGDGGGIVRDGQFAT
jgi:hypothetical protein